MEHSKTEDLVFIQTLFSSRSLLFGFHIQDAVFCHECNDSSFKLAPLALQRLPSHVYAMFKNKNSNLTKQKFTSTHWRPISDYLFFGLPCPGNFRSISYSKTIASFMRIAQFFENNLTPNFLPLYEIRLPGITAIIFITSNWIFALMNTAFIKLSKLLRSESKVLFTSESMEFMTLLSKLIIHWKLKRSVSAPKCQFSPTSALPGAIWT